MAGSSTEYENNLKVLEEVAKTLAASEVMSLEEIESQYHRGLEAYQRCKNRIQALERKVRENAGPQT